MKSFSIIIFCFITAVLFSCGNKTKDPQESGAGEQSSASFSGVYEGAIRNDLSIVFSADEKDGKVSGSYFYQRTGIDISVSGTCENNSVSIREFDAKGKETGSFTGSLFNNGDSMAGTWKNADGSRSFPFWLRRAPDPEMAKIRFKWHFVLATMKKDPELPDQPQYMEGNVYPVMSGLQNASVQEALNRQFYKAAIQDERNPKDYQSVKELSGEEYDNVAWPNGHTTTVVTIDYYDSRVLTWSSSSEWDGGAHPSFASGGYHSAFLSTGKAVTVNDLLEGEWRALLLDEIRQSSEITDMGTDMGDEDPCSHIRDTLLAQVKRWTGKEEVFLFSDRIVFISEDNRSFGCPEIARGVFEISISLDRLKPFLRPGSPAEILAKQKQ